MKTFTQQAEEIKKGIDIIEEHKKLRGYIEEREYDALIQRMASAKALQEAGTGFLSFLEEETEEWDMMGKSIAIGLGKVWKEKANIPQDNYKCLEETEKMCYQNSNYYKRKIADIQNALKILEDVLK
jgi:hypothetical protein